jgi:histone acetyltransferase MYST1
MSKREPVGRLVYSKAPYSVYEVDGEIDKLFCQNLSLFAKLFLDTKSVFFDVATFLYYLLVVTVPRDLRNPRIGGQKHQIVGFFSKEKMSWDQNNLACILVFPPWQKKGLGKTLMAVSYEISKRERKIGGPERPLSNLGRKSYVSFWSSTIARYILSLPVRKPSSVKSIAEATFILPEDIISTLKEMDIISATRKADGSIIISKSAVKEWVTKHRVDISAVVDETAFLVDWVPLEDEGQEDGVEQDI